MEPRIPRPAIWFAGSGIVASIPLHRNASRTFWVEYVLSANIRSGLVLGMPPFLLMIETSAISPVKAPESCRCPAVVTRGMDAAPRSGEKIDTFAGQADRPGGGGGPAVPAPARAGGSAGTAGLHRSRARPRHRQVGWWNARGSSPMRFATGHWSTLPVAGTGWVFVVGTRREPGDGLARSPFDGHDDTAAPGSSEAVEPATEGRAVERQSVTAR